MADDGLIQGYATLDELNAVAECDYHPGALPKEATPERVLFLFKLKNDYENNYCSVIIQDIILQNIRTTLCLRVGVNAYYEE